MELSPNSRRQYLGTMAEFGVVFGMIYITCASWILKDWFYIQLAHVLYLTLCAPERYILESPFWFLVQGRTEDAKETVLKIATRNGLNDRDAEWKTDLVIQELKVKMDNPKDVEVGRFKDLFRNRIITKYTLLSVIVMSTAYFSYYGMVTTVESFGSSLYADLIISNGLSIGCLMVTLPALTRISFRNLLSICLWIFGFVTAAYPFLYGYETARAVLTSVGRALGTAMFSLSSVYLAEIFPTSVRMIGYGFVSTIARAPGAAGPFIKEFARGTIIYAPFILLSASSLISSVFLRFLPDTRGKNLVHTVEELKAKDETK